MGSILGNAVKAQDPQVFESVEKLRRLGREWRNEGREPAFEEMVTAVKSYDANKLFNISR
eukprot:gene21333-15814_t